MASVAEKTAAAYLQRLYNNTEEDKLRDFELVSRDGAKFRVHSLLLQLRLFFYCDKFTFTPITLNYSIVQCSVVLCSVV